MKFDSVEVALEALAQGKMVIVSDDENRENEGDLVAIAELITPETINFMITYGKGLVCMPITTELAHKLELHPMVETNEEYLKTAFTVPIDVHPKFFSWMYSLEPKCSGYNCLSYSTSLSGRW